MGIRERGHRAITSPVVLQPTPQPSAQFGAREFAFFSVGFVTAVLAILYLLSE